MGYLGNTPGESFISFAKQVFTIVNSQTAYTLDFAVVDENELRLVVNNVVQEPGSGKAYTASGTTLTLSAALTNGTDEMYCVFLGKARETVTVPTITRDKLNLISDGSNPSLIAKGTSGVSEGYIQLNCAENSHGIKLKSPPHSAGQSYTLTFPQSITNNTFLKTDGSGNLSFAAAGGTNTPAFSAYLSSNQSISTASFTKIQFDTETYDTNGTYDNSSNYRFTPAVAGKYLIFANMYLNSLTDGKNVRLDLYKNGASIAFGRTDSAKVGSSVSVNFSYADSANTTDYYELFVYHNEGGSLNVASGRRTSFGANKIIE
jgi:hypothetical protein